MDGDGDAPCGMGMFVSPPPHAFPPPQNCGAPSLFCIIVGNNQRVLSFFYWPSELDLLSRLRFVMACRAPESPSRLVLLPSGI